jgi:hypothetical protein
MLGLPGTVLLLFIVAVASGCYAACVAVPCSYFQLPFLITASIPIPIPISIPAYPSKPESA